MDSPVRKSRESRKGRFNPVLNNVEHVNTQLKGKLKILTTEMKDAAEKMNTVTTEMNMIRSENILYKERLAKLEEENALLISQIEEMVNERAERDAIIEEFGTAVEVRIIKWKEILDEKDRTIGKLKENLMYAANDRLANPSLDDTDHTEIERLIQDIDRRDEIITELQTKLAEAVVEINESSLLIEKFKSDSKTKESTKGNSKDNRETNKKMQDVVKKMSTLENLLERAERDAKVKSEQLCEALAMLNKYEDENASLTEAFEEIKDLKDQMEKKNKHVEDLVDVINRLEIENSNFEDAIVVYREKLGITEYEDASIEELILERQRSHREKVEEMQRNYDRLSSENVDLKFQIRKLKGALKETVRSKLMKTNGISSDGDNPDELSYRSESKKEHVELLRMKENVKWVVEENEALRQGMHEILDCIHNQDAKSIITIQSQTLENLLQALDARHIAGWYHPAMRLQGKVSYLQGSNAELRAQLQQIRKNQSKLQGEMHQRPSSVEEGECSQEKQTLLPLSPTSTHSQNADSGRASGKPAEIDEIQRIATSEEEEEPSSRSGMEDEGFGKKSEEVYAMAKEIIAQESDFKRALTESENHRKLLQVEIVTLRKNLTNFISPEVYNELRDKYLESNIRLRGIYEDKFNEKEETLNMNSVQQLRDELVTLHKKLSEFAINSVRKDKINIGQLEKRIAELSAENEKLKIFTDIARDEALVHRAIDSTVLAEFNDLRQRILRFEMDEGQEIKETARLSLEIANHKVVEAELREQKKILERELARMRCDANRPNHDFGDAVERSGKLIDDSDYIEIIDFLQRQYAGSTTLSAWERYEEHLNKLNNDRNEVKELITQMTSQNEHLKMQHETLQTRLQIVEQLKDMLEQQIGTNDVNDIMQKFTNDTRQLLSESKYQVQISQLEEELKRARGSLSDYEVKILSMERQMKKMQIAWKVYKTTSIDRPDTDDKIIETDVKNEEIDKIKEFEAKSTQSSIEMLSIETQCTLCCNPLEFELSRNTHVYTDETSREPIDHVEIDNLTPESADEPKGNMVLLQEQLNQALALASERSIALTKCEVQLAEYRARNANLTKLLEESKTVPPGDLQRVIESTKIIEEGGTSREVLQSTIDTLQKIITQKEETIGRYQNLLKEDRDKHSEAATRLQDEIKNLKKEIAIGTQSTTLDNALVPEKDLPIVESTRMEETSILKEKISRLETELSISAELAERWHRLAEDRSRHMDSTRERLEHQHREEIESYRMELNRRERDIDELRRQLSINRRAPTTKTEVLSFMKALQIKDNRLADEIENELEHAVTASEQLSTMYDTEDSRHVEYEQVQLQLDNLRKQLQASMERERTHKSEITELQQQLSKRYMAVKAQEKKASRREMQLERKVKELEEELHDAKGMLDRQFVAQQAKRIKTAEDLGLWEKLKKWQQTAEKLKDKLKEKTDECQRLQGNYEKLRNLISCMEREKWYLRGKYSSESASAPVANWSEASESKNDALVQELQRECQELRDRVQELVGRLARQDNDKLHDQKKNSPTITFEDDDYMNGEVKKYTDIQEMLEKENLRLESENFELRLELERASVNVPRLQEKIQHLEKYVELLKSEKSIESHCVVGGGSRRESAQRTKTELERTVVALKKLVEKLQVDNKKLKSEVNAQCKCMDLREDYEVALQRIASLEMELELARKRVIIMENTVVEKLDDDCTGEVFILRQQLIRKSELLSKVKDLLAKAAANEKVLRQQIQQLEYKQTLAIIPECGTSFATAKS